MSGGTVEDWENLLDLVLARASTIYQNGNAYLVMAETDVLQIARGFRAALNAYRQFQAESSKQIVLYKE